MPTLFINVRTELRFALTTFPSIVALKSFLFSLRRDPDVVRDIKIHTGNRSTERESFHKRFSRT